MLKISFSRNHKSNGVKITYVFVMEKNELGILSANRSPPPLAPDLGLDDGRQPLTALFEL